MVNLSIYPFGGDSSEVATSMSTWGLSHPPGYPLQNLLGNILVKITPFFNVYQKTAFFSSFFTLLTTIILTSILSLFIKRKLSILLSLIYFITLFPVWLYGVVPEVFSLALFIISYQIYFLLKFEKTRQFKYFYLFLIFIGLGVCQHHIFVLFIPGYLYILFKKIRIKLDRDIFLKSVIMGLLGFLPYLYAPIVSFLNTPMDMENAKSIDGFIRLILRSSYGTFTAYSGAAPDIANQLVNMLSVFVFIIKDIKPLGLIIIIFGLVYLYKKIRYLFIFFIINIICLLYFYFISNFNLSGSFSIGTFERFLVFLYLILAMIFAFGTVYLHEILANNLRKLTNKKLIKTLVLASLYLLISILIVNSLLTNQAIIKSVAKNKIFKNYSDDLLNSLPKNSYLFLNSDHSIFLVQAAQLIDKKRPDVVRIPSLIERDYILAKFRKNNPKITIPPINKLSIIPEINYSKKNYFYSDKPISKGVWAPNGLTWRYFPNLEQYKLHEGEIIDSNITYWTKDYLLSPLSQSEKSIFFLDHIYEIYATQMSYSTDFLLSYGKKAEVNNILERFYQSLGSQYSYKTSYLNFFTREKKCTDKTEKIFDKLIDRTIMKSSDYKYLIEYIKLCNENDIQLIKKLEKAMINQTSTNSQSKETKQTTQ